MNYSTEQLLGMLESAIKGITTTSTLGATILEPYQFDRYVRALMHKTTLLPRYRFVKMESHIVDIDKIAFAEPIMKPLPAEGMAPPEKDFTSPTFTQHKLIAVGMQGTVALADRMLRRNPERQGLLQTVMDMMAERGGTDIEELGLKGDTENDNPERPLFRTNDGWIKLTRRRCVEKNEQAYNDEDKPSIKVKSTQENVVVYYNKVPITPTTFLVYEDTTLGGNSVARDDGRGKIVEVDNSGITGNIDYESGRVFLTGWDDDKEYAVKYVALSFDRGADDFPENMFDRMIHALPKEYLRSPGEWEINVPWWVMKAYRDRLKRRNTALGDEFYAQGSTRIRVPYEDVWIQQVYCMPSDKAWLTHPDNTIYGVFHEVTLETEREAKAKRTDIIIECEVDFGFEEPEASVVAEIY